MAEPLRAFDERTISPGHKWRASSALQKSIRRGKVMTALTMARALLQLDPPYLVRRLPVIALEDVGLGNLDAAEATIWALKNAAWRKRVGGTIEVVLRLVEELASGVKDRSGCDLVVTAGFDPQRAAERQWASQATARELVDVIATSRDPVSRAIAAWQLSGPAARESADMRPGKARPDLEAVIEAVAPNHRVATLMRAAWGGRTGVLPLGLGIVAQMAAHADVRVERDRFEQYDPIDGWPAECFDVHVREGRRALAYLVAAAPTLASLLRSGGVSERRLWEAAGELLWCVETDSCDRRLVFPGSRELRWQARRAGGLAWAGLRPEFHEPAIELLRANTELLDHARRRVLGVVPSRRGPREVVTPAARDLLRPLRGSSVRPHPITPDELRNELTSDPTKPR